MKRRVRTLPIVLCWLSLAAGVQAQEWTRFRGPNGAGQSDAATVPAVWSTNDYRWTTQLPGSGNSSPVLWGDRLFVQSADPDDGTQLVLCVDATTGQLLWRRDFPSTPYHIHLRNSFASASPAVDESLVYVTWATPAKLTVTALDHDGETIWQRDDLGPFHSMHGWGASPLAVGDLLIVSNQQQAPESGDAETSSIMALDRRTGELRWKTPRVSTTAGYSVPCLHQTGNGASELISCSTQHGIFALDLETGRENWSTDAFSMRTVSSPVIVGDLVFGSTGSGGGGNYVVAVRLSDHQLAYKVERQAPYVPCVVAAGDLVFLWYDKGIVTCLDAATGNKHWSERVGGSYSGSPVRAADRIYCISDEGEVVVLAAAKTFQLLGKNALGEPSRSTPAIANGCLYLRTYTQLFCVGGKS